MKMANLKHLASNILSTKGGVTMLKPISDLTTWGHVMYSVSLRN